MKQLLEEYLKGEILRQIFYCKELEAVEDKIKRIRKALKEE